MKTLKNQSKYLIYEISRCLNLKDTLKLGGVCKELHRKIHYSFGNDASRNYICLRKTGNELQRLSFQFLFKQNLCVLEIFLKAGVNINHQDNYDDTALTKSSWKGHTEIVKFLLKHGANIDHQDVWGNTALMSASGKGNIETVKLLLKYEADVNICSYHGDTALMNASKGGRTEIVNLLLKKNDRGVGANINHQRLYGVTALIDASKGGHVETVKLLLENGADPGFRDNQHNCADSALSWAIYGGHEKVANLLGMYLKKLH